MYIQNLHMPSTKKTWSLLSRHGQALILLAKNPRLRIVAPPNSLESQIPLESILKLASHFPG